MRLSGRQKRLLLLVETVALVAVFTWILWRRGRLAEPEAIVVTLAIVAAADVLSALVMERFAPTRVVLVPNETGEEHGVVVDGFDGARTGRVRVHGETWRACCAPSVRLFPGMPVQVVSREGLVLEVRPLR